MAARNTARERIMEVAGGLFEHYGYDKTTVEEISRQTGKTKTSIYYYFDGKQAILHDALAGEFNAVRTKLAEFKAESPDAEPFRFRKYLKMRMELVLGLRIYPQFIVRQYSDTENEVDSIVREVRGDFDCWEKAYFINVCEKGRQFGVFNETMQPKVFAEMLSMLLKSIETQYFVSKDRSAILATYNEMVDFLIKDNSPQHENKI